MAQSHLRIVYAAIEGNDESLWLTCEDTEPLFVEMISVVGAFADAFGGVDAWDWTIIRTTPCETKDASQILRDSYVAVRTLAQACVQPDTGTTVDDR